jgi:hypothetical protein
MDKNLNLSFLGFLCVIEVFHASYLKKNQNKYDNFN